MRAHGREAVQAWLGLATGLLLLTAAKEGRAQDLDLVWQAPDTCPTGEQVKSEFHRSLRLSPGYVPPRLSATAIVEHTGGRWFLHLHTVRNGIEGDREIEADSCTSLGRATALVLTLALGEGDLDQKPAEESPTRSDEAQSPKTEPPAAVPMAAGVPAASPDRARPVARHGRLIWAPTLEARTAWGPLPGPSLGVGAGVDLRSTWWALSARVEGWPSVSQNPAPGLQTTYEGLGGALSFCVVDSPSSFVALALCAGVEETVLRGASTGGSPGPKVAPWTAEVSSLRARLPLFDGVHIELGFELAASPSVFRPSFAVNNFGQVYAVPALSPSGVVGASFDL